MAKKSKTPTAAPVQKRPGAHPPFPNVAQKDDLTCRVLLEDQIVVVDDLLSLEECKQFIRFLDNLPLELTPAPKKGEAERVNYRTSITAPEFATHLFAVISPHLPAEGFLRPASVRRGGDAAGRAPHSLNTNIRLYKYTAGQYFGAHYDDSVRDAVTGAKSEWTLLIYLSGAQDGVQGGETLFYKDEKGKPREIIVPPLTRGSALLHRHGNECLLHEGSPVLKGVKYVLRSDLMFVN